jgi:hypothetical protein
MRARAIVGRPLLMAIALIAAACSSEPSVNYGSPGNLNEAQLPGEAGVQPLSCGDAGLEGGAGGGDGGCTVSWSKDLYPKMTASDPTAWGCATSNCHGKTGNAPLIDPTDPAKALASLEAYHMISQPQLAYVSTSGDPTKSTIECNVSAGCTPAMPQTPFPPLSNADRCALDTWLRCGAPGN